MQYSENQKNEFWLTMSWIFFQASQFHKIHFYAVLILDILGFYFSQCVLLKNQFSTCSEVTQASFCTCVMALSQVLAQHISTPASCIRLGAIHMNSKKALTVITEMFFLCSNYSDISILLTFKLPVFFQKRTVMNSSYEKAPRFLCRENEQETTQRQRSWCQYKWLLTVLLYWWTPLPLSDQTLTQYL